jgi:chromosome segregation ATPase
LILVTNRPYTLSVGPSDPDARQTGADAMTTKTREAMAELKDAIEEIDCELEGALEELKEIKERIRNLREDRKWRLEAYRFLKAGGEK